MADKDTIAYEIKTPVSALRLGMYVSRLDKNWLDSSFLFQGFLIENDRQIKQLKKECNYVYVDSTKEDYFFYKNKKSLHKKIAHGVIAWFVKTLARLSRFFSGQEQQDVFIERRKKKHYLVREKTNTLQDITEYKIATNTIRPPQKSTTLERELNTAKQSYATVTSLMKEFSSHVQAGDTIDMLIAEKAIYECMTSVLRSPDAIQLVTRLKNKHQASWQRSMNNAVLAISLGRFLNLNDDELTILGLCGLLHDIGYLRISKEAFELAENKKEMIRSHAKLGYEILLSSSAQSAETVAMVAYTHHEHIDGSGFPQGLIGDQISPYSRMITIVDTYNSLTNPFRKEKRLNHYDAIVLMLEKVNVYYDEVLLRSFYQCIGTYPVGCVVELNTGEIAMVIEVNDRYKLRPKIMLLTHPNKEKCKTKTINLADNEVNQDKVPYVIRKIIVHPESYGILL